MVGLQQTSANEVPVLNRLAFGFAGPHSFHYKEYIAKVWICVPKHEGSATGLPGMAIGAKAQRVGVDFYDMCGLPSL